MCQHEKSRKAGFFMSKKLNHIYGCIDTDPNLTTSSRKEVFKLLSSYSKYYRKAVFMSPNQLYELKRMEDSTARRCLKYLESINYIKLLKRGGASGREYKANLYKINMPETYRERMQAAPKMSMEEQIKYAKRTLGKAGVDLNMLDALLLLPHIKSEKKVTIANLKIKDKISKLIASA